MQYVPFYPYGLAYSSYLNTIGDIVNDIVSRGAFILQGELASFEKTIANSIGAKFAIGVGNATDGLEMLLQAGRMPPGAEVLISTHTMSATASAVKAMGGVPVAVDIDELGMMSAEDLESKITTRSWGLIVTQLNGAIANMAPIVDIARKFELKLYEDSAQALMATSNGRYAGTFGEGGVFSFYPAKVLGCLGDGGMVVTNSEETFNAIMAMRDHGRVANGEMVMWARNSRLDNLQAAFLNYFFVNHLESWISHRRKITTLYDEMLEDITEIRRPQYNFRAGNDSNFQNYELCATARDDLQAHLKSRGIGTLVQWGGRGIHQLSVYQHRVSLPAAEKYLSASLMLPLNHIVSQSQATYVAGEIRAFYRGK